MSVKRVDPNATFRIVSRQDDALVHETPEELQALKDAGTVDERGNPITRYDRYLENFDQSILKFKEGSSPTLFVVRALRNPEMAPINQKYYAFDPETRTIRPHDTNGMLLEMCALGLVGIEEGGQISKPNADELPFPVAIEIGGIVNLIGVLGKNLKKA